jgi:hypothetical protein
LDSGRPIEVGIGSIEKTPKRLWLKVIAGEFCSFGANAWAVSSLSSAPAGNWPGLPLRESRLQLRAGDSPLDRQECRERVASACITQHDGTDGLPPVTHRRLPFLPEVS